jgi:hypothetical protein
LDGLPEMCNNILSGALLQASDGWTKDLSTSYPAQMQILICRGESLFNIFNGKQSSIFESEM